MISLRATLDMGEEYLPHSARSECHQQKVHAALRLKVLQHLDTFS